VNPNPKLEKAEEQRVIPARVRVLEISPRKLALRK
jgi:hypothetical protein